MPATELSDLTRMRGRLWFEDHRPRALSRFWLLLVAAAVIASAGVIADSTATVIGAMIVAPLMTPIMGMVLAVVTAHRGALARSAVLVGAGAGVAIAIGFAFGFLAPIDIVADTSSQVAARVSPRLVDLVAALATGAVGAFAQCREDVSDTLPGVAIAISLVPPLTVVGLTAEAGAWTQAGGALLLFATNVAAILLAGCTVMAVFGVHRFNDGADPSTLDRRRAGAAVVALAVAVVVPLGVHSARTATEFRQVRRIGEVAEAWAAPSDWRLVGVERRDDGVLVRVSGIEPIPDAEDLERALDAAGLGDVSVTVALTLEGRIELGGAAADVTP
jgi:uncharacterized hydrophobic protein (TIGR00271 family)